MTIQAQQLLRSLSNLEEFLKNLEEKCLKTCQDRVKNLEDKKQRLQRTLKTSVSFYKYLESKNRSAFFVEFGGTFERIQSQIIIKLTIAKNININILRAVTFFFEYPLFL